MAEVIAGFAAVSSVLAVIDFGAKVTSLTVHLIKGTHETLRESIETRDLMTEYESIGDAAFKLVSQEDQTRLGIQRLCALAESCRAKSGEMLDTLRTLEVAEGSSGIKRVWQSARAAVRAQKARKVLEQGCARVEQLNGQISTEILLLLRRGQQELDVDSQKLLAVVEASHASTVRSVLQARVEICDAVGRVLAHLSERQNSDLEQMLIDCISYPEVNTRRDAIIPAYGGTFEWVVEDESSPFRKWLREDGGIYWVSGKAGSGKSTLMKTLAQHTTTNKLLIQWAAQAHARPRIAEFYFWYAGTVLQKSVQGLLRSLLVQILEYCQDSVRIAFPTRTKGPDGYGSVGFADGEILQGIRNIAAACETQQLMTRNGSPCRLCLFIDGLDEFHGDHWELIDLLKGLTHGQQIKICASSRTWNAFRTAFEYDYPFLRLEDLTRSDIHQYVHGTLTSTASGIMTSKRSTSTDMLKMTDDLANLIVTKAEGVFLWVYLVVRSVQEGLWEGDQPSILLQRVEDFPSDIEQFFQQILGRVNKVYRTHTAMALKLAHVCAVPEPGWEISDFTDFWLIRDNAATIARESQFGTHVAVQICNQEKVRSMESETEAFLSACCKDLILLSKVPGQQRALKEVGFLHRTVYDFLSSDEMQTRMAANLPVNFGGHDTAKQMALARSKTLLSDDVREASYRFAKATEVQFGDQVTRDQHRYSAQEGAMVMQYQHLARIYRRTFPPTPDYGGFMIQEKQALAIFAAFRCTDVFTEDHWMKMGDSHMDRIAWAFPGALGLSPNNPFRLSLVEPELVECLLKLDAFPCVHIFRALLQSWVDFDRTVRQQRSLESCSEPECSHARFLVSVIARILRRGLLWDGEDQRAGESLADRLGTSSMQALSKTLSPYLEAPDLEQLLHGVRSDYRFYDFPCDCIRKDARWVGDASIAEDTTSG